MMARQTITDYKTVEEQREVTICDQCGRTDDDEGCTIVDIAINPKNVIERKTEKEIVKTFEKKRQAEAYMKDYQPPIKGDYFKGVWGVANNKRFDHVKTQASATADICQVCLSELLGIELKENQEINNVDIEDGGVNFEVTENVVKKYPTPTIPPFGITSIVFIAFAIVTFPIALFLILFANAEWEEGDCSHKEIFVIGTLGTFLWSILLLFVINPTLFLALF